MAILSKVVSGIMHQETFDRYNLMWELSPNDFNRISFENGSVMFGHGDQRISMSIPTPSEDYVFQATLTHEPVVLSDIGGIIISSITDNQIECQTYYNTGGGLQQYYKCIKVCVTDNVYTFFASVNGIQWVYIGNAELSEAHRIGFFLEGVPTALSKDLVVHNVTIYKSNIITINNVPYRATIKIIDSTGHDILSDKQFKIQQYNGKAYIDVTNLELPVRNATVQILDEGGYLVVEHIGMDVCGGDIFECTENVEFKIGEQVLSSNYTFDLGRLEARENIYPLLLKNLDTLTLSGKTLKVEAFSDYYRGMDLALVGIQDLEGETVFAKELPLPPILGGSALNLLIKIEKDLKNIGPFIADKYRFKIVLE